MADLTIGWNLGNALDAPGDETAWGNPRITPELIQAVADAGFDLVRIPVTWSPHMGDGPNFEIEQKRLERVSEVVGYARDAGLTAVINIHHDGADNFAEVEWITVNDADGETTEANNAKVEAQFVKVWLQIAEHFADQPADLLFESMNEIHDGYGPADPRHVAFVNRLNGAFVDTVRQTGGNNAERLLIVPGYNTNIDATIDGFELPSDSAEDKLIVSVHYYDPYTFALTAETNTWGEGAEGADEYGQEADADRQFDRLKATFIDKGVPVFMGEYGATHQADFKEYRQKYMAYVTKAAAERGILPVYWDNGGQGSGGENFALFDRATGEVLHPDLLEAMMRAAQQR